MKASIIISIYSVERLEDVKTLLISLHEQSVRPHEILLVFDPDDALVAAYSEEIADDAVTFLMAPAKGLSAARTHGVEHASGDIAVFIDDDATAERTWLETLLRNYVDDDVLGVGGNIIPDWRGEPPFWFPPELYWIIGCIYEGHPVERSTVRNLIGCNMSFRRDVFGEVGGFAAELGRRGKQLAAAEETEFYLRLHRNKPEGHIIYDPAAVVYHTVTEDRKKLGYVLRRAYNEGISKAVLAKRYAADDGALSTEGAYLRKLPRTIARRLGQALRLRQPGAQISQAFVLLLAVGVTGIGYLLGRR